MVIAIIGMLVALLLPAVQAAREAARRTECLNNLRQVGLAVWGYTDANKNFPAGYEVKVDSTGSVGNNGVVLNGFFTLILPYAEGTTIESLYDYEQGFDHASNQPAVNSLVPVFLCPSAPNGERTVPLHNTHAFLSPDLGHTGKATDYFGIRNVVEGASNVIADTSPLKDRVRGVFRAYYHENTFGAPPTPEKPLRPGQIIDGTSKTVMLVEIAGRPERFAGGRQLERHDYWSGPWSGVNGEMLYEINTENAIKTKSPSKGTCFLNCHNYYTPYSFHPGGLHVMLCDGSAHFLNNDTEFAVWLSVAQPDDGELVESPW